MGKVVIKALGFCLPKNCVTNDELSKKIDTSDEWIKTRTGINSRYISGEGENTSDLAAEAVKDLFNNLGETPDIDLIIVATTTSDKIFPATAMAVQKKLALPPCVAFDIQAVCSGFLYATEVAKSLLETKKYRNALVIASETMSKILDWNDRSTCVLFGDGAGAALLSLDEDDNTKNSCVVDVELSGDGNYYESLYTLGGVSETQSVGYITMNGKEIFRLATEKMFLSINKMLKDHNMTIDDIDWIIPHQANIRIINNLADRLNVSKEKFIITIDRYANTGAASVIMALADANSRGQLKKNDKILLTSVGGGLTWGTAFCIW